SAAASARTRAAASRAASRTSLASRRHIGLSWTHVVQSSPPSAFAPASTISSVICLSVGFMSCALQRRAGGAASLGASRQHLVLGATFHRLQERQALQWRSHDLVWSNILPD